ncbi:MAG: hypothetical protein ACLFQX_01755 [Candidatus Kapaibacterium sp.]
MKNIAAILIFALTAGLAGCDSPLDVPANRVKKVVEKNQNPEDGLSIFPAVLDFGYVARVDSKTMGFQIANTGDNSVTINSILPKTYMDMYFVDYPQLPITLGPKGSDSASEYISIQFSARNLGKFTDTLRFNGKREPSLALNAIVPSVSVGDCHFGGTSIGTDAYEAVDIVNRGDSPAIINKVIIQAPDKCFKFLSTLPVVLSPGEFKRLIVRFSPAEKKQYNAILKFEIECEGYVHDQTKLSGYGI